MDTITILKPDDMHVHLRQGEPAADYLRDSARYTGRIVVMPNTKPPVTSVRRYKEYREEILRYRDRERLEIDPLFAFQIVPELDRKELSQLKRFGAVCGKYYPLGVTTNSDTGVADTESIYPVFSLMEELGIVLSIHGELPGAPVMERETAFLPVFRNITERFPGLRIIYEHVSTKEAMELVNSCGENTAATITPHHLLKNIDDMAGALFRPSLFCKPVLKGRADMEFLREEVLGGNPKVFYGSDSAPHPAERKKSDAVPAGVYSSPSGIPALAGFIFDRAGVKKGKELIENFCSKRGAIFYGLEPATGTLTLERRPWKVPDEISGCIPFCRGEEILWHASGINDLG
ncbi:MAG: amidohydrolase family protein [Spirochaetia bacterium]